MRLLRVIISSFTAGNLFFPATAGWLINGDDVLSSVKWTSPVLSALLDGGWLGSRVVSVLDSGSVGFKSQSRRCRVTVLGKLFTSVVPLFTKQ